MKSILFSLIILSINGTVIDFTGISQCSCDLFKNQIDCSISTNCQWVSGVCSQIECDKIETQGECNDTGSYCAYKELKCEKFTQCDSYSYIDPMQCAYIGCMVGSISSGAYYCQDLIHPTCSDIEDETTCQMLGCSYKGSCQTPSCSEQTQAKCNIIRGDKFLTFQFCQYDGTSCQDGDIALDSNTCTVLTSGAYYWNEDNQKCQSCSDTSQQNLITSMIGVILLILY